MADQSSDHVILSNDGLYEHDFFAWTQEQAARLRAGELAALDLENLAEEIESMGRRDYREVLSRLAVLLHHLLKWRYQSDHQSRSWRSTIWTQRRELARVLRASPSLTRQVPVLLPDAYEDGRRKALEETGLLHLPEACPFELAQVLDTEWYPE